MACQGHRCGHTASWLSLCQAVWHAVHSHMRVLLTIKSAMQSIKDMPVVQDGPPPGGFPSIRYARRLPSTGPTGFTLFAVGTAIMAFGFYRVRALRINELGCGTETLYLQSLHLL